jgi:type I restriction enzyme S subunit
MSDDVVEVLQRTFPKSVQPGLPKLKPPKSGWKSYRFGELLEQVQRRVHLQPDETYDLVTVKRSRGGIESRGRLRGSQISVTSQFRIAEGDFLISKRQIVHGACGVVSSEFDGAVVSNEYSVLRCKPNIDLAFLQYLSHSVYFQQTCFHSSIGVHIEKMIFKLDEWLKWPINIPSLPEQQKIAAFLGAVDAKLSVLAAKQLALGRFKAGLMQKLFSQQLRFTRDDGRAFPDWEEKRLGTVASIRAGDFVSASNISAQQHSGLFRCYGGNGLRGYVTTFNREGRYSLIGRQGALCGNVHFVDGKFHATEHALVAEAYDMVVPEWLFFLLDQMQLNQYATGLAQPGISAETVKNLRTSIPSRAEQTKIATALSSMDTKIQSVADQVAKLQTFKKGLLQQMFV